MLLFYALYAAKCAIFRRKNYCLGRALNPFSNFFEFFPSWKMKRHHTSEPRRPSSFATVELKINLLYEIQCSSVGLQACGFIEFFTACRNSPTLRGRRSLWLTSSQSEPNVDQWICFPYTVHQTQRFDNWYYSQNLVRLYFKWSVAVPGTAGVAIRRRRQSMKPQWTIDPPPIALRAAGAKAAYTSTWCILFNCFNVFWQSF